MRWRLRVVIALWASVAWAGGGWALGGEDQGDGGRLSLHVGMPGGIGCLRPETCGLVDFEVVNSTDRPAEVLALVFFAEDRYQQYGRQVWVPAHARRRSWCAVIPPPSAPPPPDRIFQGRGAELESLLIDRSGATNERLQGGPERRPPPDSRLVSIDHSPAVTAVIIGARADEGAEESDVAAEETAYQVVSAARLAVGQEPVARLWYQGFLPPVVESLDGLDHLVLYNNRLASDAAALVAVRRWLFGGGRIWVMLDRVDPATVELLLGDAFHLHVVDRVGLTQVSIEDARPDEETTEQQPREFEEPVDLVRVLVGDVEVVHTVNGWPASFWQRVGRGDVLFTALGPRGWVRPRRGDDPQPPRTYSAPPVHPNESFAELGARFFKPPRPPLVEQEALEPYLLEQIGYRIVGRGWIVGILGTFCLGLLAGGTWLGRRGRLDGMVWLAPALAAGAASALTALGFASRQSVPPTVAVAQVVEAEPGADDLRMSGLMAMYNQETSDASLGARRGGLFFPDMAGLAGSGRWMVRTDLDAWHWERLELPNGVRTARFEHAMRADRPVAARAAFGPRGLSGHVDGGPFEGLSDVVLAAPSQRNLAVAPDGHGEFTAGTADVLATGEFVAETLLSDEQRRRQLIYEWVLRREASNEFPAQPTLLAWAKPLEMGFTLPAEAKRLGSALFAVPLAIERTPPGTRVVIPSPFLPFRSIRGPLSQLSSAYSNNRREWLELHNPSEVCLRFQLPESVLPAALEHATLTIRGSVPSRELRVLGFLGEEQVTVAARSSLVGTRRFDVDRADLLELDERGGLLLGFGVGAQTNDGAAPLWKIEDVELEITGRVLESDE